MQYTLFSPMGRLSRNAFLRGMILCLVAAMLIQILVAFVSPTFSILNYALIYPFLCVFGKRLHDAGKSAWLYLLFLLGYFVLSSILGAGLTPLLSSEAAAMQAELNQLAKTEGISAMFSAAIEQAPQIAHASIMTTLVVLIIVNGILGMIAATLKSDPNANMHGPPISPHRAPDSDEFS